MNIGYRLSAFGFLASDEPSISGNFGFKDQWLALLWIRENIASFGGEQEHTCLSEINGALNGDTQATLRISKYTDSPLVITA